jgi:hypothetical protein
MLIFQIKLVFTVINLFSAPTSLQLVLATQNIQTLLSIGGIFLLEPP